MPTWRANRDWGQKLGYGRAALDDVNRRWLEIAFETRAGAGLEGPVVVDGLIGHIFSGRQTPSSAVEIIETQLDHIFGGEDS